MSEDQDKRTGAVPNGTIDPKNRPVVQVRDVMYKLFLTVTPDTPVRKVFRMFIKYRLMAIPVVDEEDHLIGLITSADLMYKQTKPHVPRSLPIIGSKIFTNRMNGYAKDFKKLMDEPCEKTRTKDVIIATPEADTEQIAGVMVIEHLKVLPVVENHRVVGIITRTNILQDLYKEFCTTKVEPQQ